MMKRLKQEIWISLLLGTLTFLVFSGIGTLAVQGAALSCEEEPCPTPTSAAYQAGDLRIYLPFLAQTEHKPAPAPQTPTSPAPQPTSTDPVPSTPPPAGTPIPPSNSSTPLIHLPHFQDKVVSAQTAVFWFGKVNTEDNYADVRIGYTDQDLFVHVAVFDRYLWYAEKAKAESLDQWDGVALLLNLENASGEKAYRFLSGLSWWEKRNSYEAAFEGTSNGWRVAPLEFSTKIGWRGDGVNDNSNLDRGWTTTYTIPFSSLGMAGAPPEGTQWKLGVELFDRDDSQAAPLATKYWPRGMNPLQPKSWGRISFGLPKWTPPALSEAGQTTIRHQLNGAVVMDGAVGGDTTCSENLDYWTEWGDTPVPGSQGNADFNVQNQSDVADWPCYSKYYVTFPLESLPKDQAILSAKLTLHQFGNSGGGQWGAPPDSLIQIFTTRENWDEQTLTWNNAPHVYENVSRAWVQGLTKFPGWPGVAREWDLGAAVAEAYATRQPLRLIIYSADTAYHSGKYFVSSDAGDWNERARPQLDIVWGNP